MTAATPTHDPASAALAAAYAELSPAQAMALQWLVRRGDGLDSAGEAAFLRWLQQDDTHRQAWRDMDATAQAIAAIPAAQVQRLRNSLAQPPRTRPTASWADRLRGWLGALAQPQALAAGLVLSVLSGGYYAWDLRQPVFVSSYQTQRGEQLHTDLPEGSQLTLDTATQAEVRLYRHRREVRLPEGQAMFVVSPDAARPFDVLAGATRITVLGTRFSVRYTPSLGVGQVQVAVEQGHVRVSGTGRGAAQVELGAGQSVVADAQGRLAAVAALAAAELAPWRQQRLNFNDTPLSTALAELQRYGDTGLVVRDPAVAALRLTGSVDLQRLADFKRSLPQVLPLRLQPGGAPGSSELVAAPR